MEKNSNTMPDIDHVPDIGFYMDQVITYTEKYMGKVPLTKTMINNYAKDGLIPAPVKKKYSREHLMMLLLIKCLKQSLPVNRIKDYLVPLALEVSSGEKGRLYFLYEEFLNAQRELELLSNKIEKEIREKSKTDLALPLFYSYVTNYLLENAFLEIEDMKEII